MTDYETCNWCKYKCDCAHKVPYPELVRIPVSPIKEKSMNTYTITATAMYRNTYTVESGCEEDAISEVEWGNVDPDDSEFDGEVTDVECVDVEYGDRNYHAGLMVNFVIRGDVEADTVRDALWDILSTFDGKTTSAGRDGELELVGFNVEDIEED